MNINDKNNTGQEKVVTVGRLNEYVDWLNETNGGSMLRVTSGTIGSRKTLKIESMLENGNGTIYWNRTDSVSTVSLSGEGSITVTGGTSTYPKGKFYLEYDGTRYPTLDNSNTSTYTGYEEMPQVPSEDVEKGVTYHDITASTYTRYYDEGESVDGLIIDDYSVGDGREEYAENQLVVEKDVNYGKLEYSLEVRSLTVEIDAMTDTEEYKYGVVPGSDDLPYAQVYYKTNNKEERITNFSLNKVLTDNASTAGKTFADMNISRGSTVATAQKVQSGTSEAYKVDIYYYSDSGYTLSSTTLSTRVGTAASTIVRVSNHSFSSSQRNVTVAIGENGQVTFAIKQRGEIYGYYPVNAYREGTSDYLIDENGNMALTSADKFVAAYNTTDNYEKESRIGSDLASYMGIIQHASIGWLSNAGDNFGSSALSGGKTSLSNSDVSTYDAELTREGFTESERNEVCGKDVYNTDATVYNRGDSVGNGYHIAYANDVYGNNDNKSGFSGTTHLFISKGYLEMNTPTFSCTNEYMGYDCDSFSSEYDYDVAYYRDYYKDCHSYGMTSIMRRFRKINGEYVDSSISTYADGNARKKSSVVVSGDSFPKHISGKTISLETYSSWYEMTNQTTDGIGESSLIRSGENWVSGWTSVLEDGDSSDYYRTTSRDMKLDHGNWYYIRVPDNEDDYYHSDIAPFFYMVDAETCQGASSGGGYSFVTSKSIVDRYNGTISERYFELDDDLYFRDDYSNEQAPRKNMLTYNNGRHDHSGWHVLAECCPSAPLQEVSWVDYYSPNTSYGGLVSNDGFIFVDSNDEFAGTGTTPYRAVKYIPAPFPGDWGTMYGYEVTIDDVNKFSFSSDGEALSSFAGDTNYKYGHENSSTKTLTESISATASEYEYDASMFPNDDSLCGYKLAEYEGYTYSSPVAGVSEDTEAPDLFDGTTFTGDTYYYLDRGGNYGNVRTSTSHTKHMFSVMDKYINGQDPYRPCYGDVTVPYWTTTLHFKARFFDFDDSDPTTLNVISAFNLQVFANGTLVPISNSGDTLVWTSSVHCKIVQGRVAHSLDGEEAYRTVSLVLIFSDVYEGNGDGGTIEIKVTTDDGCTLRWNIDGKPEQKVGSGGLTQFGVNGWGSYKGNGDKGTLACIGSEGTNSVAQLTIHNSSTFDTRLSEIPSGEAGDSDWC